MMSESTKPKLIRKKIKEKRNQSTSPRTTAVQNTGKLYPAAGIAIPINVTEISKPNPHIYESIAPMRGINRFARN